MMGVAIWAAVLQWTRVGLGGLVFLVLARWLALEDIGAAGSALALVGFVQSLQRAAIPTFIVQAQEPSERDLSTLFWASVAAGCFTSLLIFSAGWALHGTSRHHQVGSYLMVLAVGPVLASASAVQEGLLQKRMQIRQIASRTSTALLAATILALGAGYLGAGGWALVLFSVTSSVVSVFLVFAVMKWRPKYEVDIQYLRRSIGVLSGLIGRYGISAAAMPFLQVVTLFALGAGAAGIFQIAHRVLVLADSLVGAPVRFVVTPLIARASRDRAVVALTLTRAIQYTAMLAWPLYLWLAIASPILLNLVLGPSKGEQVGAITGVFIAGGIPAVVTGVVAQALIGAGFSGVAFRRTLLMIPLGVLPAAVAALHSLEALVWTYVILIGWAGLTPSLLISKKFLGLNGAETMRKLLRVGSCTAVAGLVMSAVNAIATFSPVMKLVVITAPALLTYVLCMGLVCRAELAELGRLLMSRRDLHGRKDCML